MKAGTIYGLICPIKKHIFYVGQTTMGLRQKLAISKTHSKGDYGKWIIELTTSGLLEKLEIVPLERNVLIAEITGRERFWINFCNNQHPLINKNFSPRNTKRGKLGEHSLFRYFALDKEFIAGSSTLEDLINAVNSIYPNQSFSKRTVQLDIEELRHNSELRFYAPIHYDNKSRTYSYADPNYSILKVIESRFYKSKSTPKAA